jgi:hypothetical protein
MTLHMSTLKAFGIVSVLFACFSLPANPFPAEAGWVSLFNGKDLSGWKLHGGEKWYVEDGAIVCEGTTKKYAYLATEKTYRDFILKLRFKAEAPGNSGVFFRSALDGTDIRGIQFEVDPSPRNLTGGLYESGGRMWLIKPTEEGQRAYKPGEWNEIELQAHGSRIVTKVNGVTVADFTDPEPRFHEGVIALQIHEGDDVKIRWKDIAIRELKN